jgi:hypothetical protein
VTGPGRRAGAAVMRRPPGPTGRHAIKAGPRWSAARGCRNIWRLAGRRASHRPAAAVLTGSGMLICVIALGGVVAASRDGRAATPLGITPFVTIPDGRAAELPDSAHLVQAPLPVALIIPAIGVRTAVIRLGRTAAGALQVPAATSLAGWYTGSPRPGELGASVIAGHVDSSAGPGVFFRLRLVRPHDLILVRRTDNSLAAFRVLAVHVYAKSRFPTSAVYGPTPAAELRIVTCGGTFDQATGHYLSNVIVFAIAVRWQHRARTPRRRRAAVLGSAPPQARAH